MKLLCDVEKCNPEIKAALVKMLQKLLGIFSIIEQQKSCSPHVFRVASGDCLLRCII